MCVQYVCAGWTDFGSIGFGWKCLYGMTWRYKGWFTREGAPTIDSMACTAVYVRKYIVAGGEHSTINRPEGHGLII